MTYAGEADVRAQPKALHRGLDVLERVAREGEMGFAELQHGLDIPPASFARILSALVDRGCLIKTDGGRYGLGLALVGLAASARTSNLLVQAAGKALPDLAAATNEAAELVAFEAGRFVFLDRCQSDRAVALVARPGGVFETNSTTAIGRLAMAHGWSGRGELAGEEAEAIRRAGYCQGTQNNDEVIRAVTALYATDGTCVGCLGIAAPAYRVGKAEEKQFRRLLLQKAAVVTERLKGR